jgi:hypothetical protein
MGTRARQPGTKMPSRGSEYITRQVRIEMTPDVTPTRLRREDKGQCSTRDAHFVCLEQNRLNTTRCYGCD